MAINSKTHVIISIVIPIKDNKELFKKAKENNRSKSAQAVTYIQEGLKNG